MLGLVFLLFVVPAHAERILLMGDSHTCGTAFGPQMAANLKDGGKNQVVVYCSGGTSAYHWVKGFKAPWLNRCQTYTADQLEKGRPAIVRIPREDPYGKKRKLFTGIVKGSVSCVPGSTALPPLDQVLEKVKPDRVVVALGTNNAGGNALPFLGAFANILKKAGKPCAWVGPPTFGRGTNQCRELGDKLDSLVIPSLKQQIAGACSYVDSHEFTPPPKGADCIHRYGKDALAWADGVAGKILGGGASPPPRPQAPAKAKSVVRPSTK